ncbi:hypothetical protein A3A46_01795 [Candidatus Roizmanbacteria bacterium RIFCSPLOWO2_01_FULL_37_13]|uniref:DUF5660 domain-containing protein n=1 Tax=Candidatus Roizmanbacteria bacterium RIFCSPHIGHO2_02_FULL_38_11 TaxID=1802039 RepID=A0A1F7H200_9BACT|nr:MAG: hypothetical protein A3C25_05700 [Candidatus Roizmanbacteria bacterium RIFCSPHIGHO2_02_FULL_38_11]OGK42131.1 MAG: hypothetical protein A3A46_01795 [Candidatus Roizmanbacteria bacterium RIFCSPLOWO2_01_FULL_37_13]
MTNTIGSKSKKTKLHDKQTIESLKGFDNFFGNYDPDYQNSEEQFWPSRETKKTTPSQRKEFSLFNYQHYYEQEIVKKEIKQLTDAIRKEIEFIKKADSALLQEVKDVQRLTLESLPEKPGIYHIRFFEIILQILRTLRAKIGESRTWLQAMISKKKKRGSLFAVRSKKKGTLYSLSQELQSARSIQ